MRRRAMRAGVVGGLFALGAAAAVVLSALAPDAGNRAGPVGGPLAAAGVATAPSRPDVTGPRAAPSPPSTAASNARGPQDYDLPHYPYDGRFTFARIRFSSVVKSMRRRVFPKPARLMMSCCE